MTAISRQEASERGHSSTWKTTLVLTFLVLGWIFLLYRKTVWSMVAIWSRSDTFAHGFFVLPIVLWLIWRQRESLRGERPAPSWLALPLLLLAGMVWFLGDMAAANALSQSAFIIMLAVCVPALLGWQVAYKLAFPLGFLIFAVPLGEFLLPPLMNWTAQFTVAGLRLSGVPVYQDGRQFVIPSGSWSVVEACSGIRYLIASLMAGTLFAYLNFRSLRRRLAFVGVSMVVPVLANWLRAYGIVMLGHLSGNKLAVGVDHLIYGWLFFGIVITLMFVVGSRWAESEAPRPAIHAPPGAPAVPAASRPNWGRAGLVAAVATLPVLAMNALERVNRAGPALLEKDASAFTRAGWKILAEPVSQWQPAYRDAADSWHQTFGKDGQTVGLYVGYYRNQDHDRKMVTSVNRLLPSGDRDWSLAVGGRRQVGPGEKPVTVNVAELRPSSTADGPAGRLVLWQWYWVAGRSTADAGWAKAYAAWSRVLGQGDDSAVIIVHAPAGQAGGAEAALEAFTATAGRAIEEALDATRRRR